VDDVWPVDGFSLLWCQSIGHRHDCILDDLVEPPEVGNSDALFRRLHDVSKTAVEAKILHACKCVTGGFLPRAVHETTGGAPSFRKRPQLNHMQLAGPPVPSIP
jgi:hypothetical protein